MRHHDDGGAVARADVAEEAFRAGIEDDARERAFRPAALDLREETSRAKEALDGPAVERPPALFAAEDAREVARRSPYRAPGRPVCRGEQRARRNKQARDRDPGRPPQRAQHRRRRDRPHVFQAISRKMPPAVRVSGPRHGHSFLCHTFHRGAEFTARERSGQAARRARRPRPAWREVVLRCTMLPVRRISLFVAQGPDYGRVFELRPPGGSIGRAADNTIVLSDPTVSRLHAEIRLSSEAGGEGRIVARAGKNPTLLNDAPIDEAPLRAGDRLRLGTTVLLVGLPAGEAPPPPPAALAAGGDDLFGPSRSTLSFPVAVLGGARLVGMVGRSAGFVEAQNAIARVAPTDATVLITGESGTGKELAARAIHYNSRRAERPFVVVDCGALPSALVEAELFGYERGAFTGADRARAGRFEEASGGTVFLDEIGELPIEAQPALLRVLEERKVRRLGATRQIPVDVRVIAATNRDLERAIGEGRFRPDLYYRLAVATIRLPPLRERLDDMEELVRYWCDRFAPECGRAIREIPPETVARLRAHSWPGNLRELRNAVRAALAFGTGDVLRPEDFRLLPQPAPPAPAPPLSAGPLWDEAYERARIVEALRAAQGNKTRAAALLGIGRTTLYAKLKQLGLGAGR